MSTNITKGESKKLIKRNGAPLSTLRIGCNWGAIRTHNGFMGIGRQVENVDLDLSCIMLDNSGMIVDHIYSPLYRPEFLSRYGMPPGKLLSNDSSATHSGDEAKGSENEEEDTDKEAITVLLNKVSRDTESMFFFLNNSGDEDFSQIPFASVRIYDGAVSSEGSVLADFRIDSSATYNDKRAVILGAVKRDGDGWAFHAIGDVTADRNLCETIKRILVKYNPVDINRQQKLN